MAECPYTIDVLDCSAPITNPGAAVSMTASGSALARTPAKSMLSAMALISSAATFWSCSAS